MMFAWVLDFAKRPVPQIWPELIPHEKERTVATYELRPREENLSFDQLRRLYPAPQEAKS